MLSADRSAFTNIILIRLAVCILPIVSLSTIAMSIDPCWRPIQRLILGSKSWSRRHLLASLGVPAPLIAAPNIDESLIRHADPAKLVLHIAVAKAEAVLQRRDVADASGLTLLITGDSVVTHKDMVLEKPRCKDEARRFLRSYASAPATTVSSVVVVDVGRRVFWSGVDAAEVYFREMPEEVIEELVEDGGAMESAGGLRIEHPKVERYTECILGERSAVMGFSLPLVRKLLMQAIAGEGGAKL